MSRIAVERTVERHVAIDLDVIEIRTTQGAIDEMEREDHRPPGRVAERAGVHVGLIVRRAGVQRRVVDHGRRAGNRDERLGGAGGRYCPERRQRGHQGHAASPPRVAGKAAHRGQYASFVFISATGVAIST